MQERNPISVLVAIEIGFKEEDSHLFDYKEYSWHWDQIMEQMHQWNNLHRLTDLLISWWDKKKYQYIQTIIITSMNWYY